MNQTDRQGRSWPLAKIAIASLVGLVVLVLLFPASGITTEPPECSSVFGYTVPCDAGWSLAAGGATAAVVGLLFWIAGRGDGQGMS
ncbi:MAG TPA: hypothetical protein VFH63_01070 [candidate division Zixibacteria bacterium]|nr:hypothetical protein [candidate division Zixibacteria bacterium]